MEKLRRSSKKAGKTCVLGAFSPKTTKFIGFFRRKTISKTPKAIRPQATGHWDPLRNHRAEAEEEREEREEGEEREEREEREGRKREKRGKRGVVVLCGVGLWCFCCSVVW